MITHRIATLRFPGFIVAALLVTVAFLGNALASDERELLSRSELILQQLGAMAFALPLLLPWRLFVSKDRWRVLLAWLILDAVVLTSLQLVELAWLFEHRPFDIWVTYILPTSMVVVAGVWMAVLAAVLTQNERNSAQIRRSG